MPRYVILEHDHPHLHWDFMLEAGERLRTWRLSSPPVANQELVVEPIADHRRAYLDYEGPVSGDRGTVKRWDAGTFEWREDGTGRIVVELIGSRISGIATVTCVAGNWLMSWTPSIGGLQGSSGEGGFG